MCAQIWKVYFKFCVGLFFFYEFDLFENCVKDPSVVRGRCMQSKYAKKNERSIDNTGKVSSKATAKKEVANENENREKLQFKDDQSKRRYVENILDSSIGSC